MKCSSPFGGAARPHGCWALALCATCLGRSDHACRRGSRGCGVAGRRRWRDAEVAVDAGEGAAAAPGSSDAVASPVRRRDLVPSRADRCLGLPGVGKASQGRFGSFRCQARMVAINKNVAPVTKTVWFKVRRQGAGQVCASLTGFVSIPAGCLKTTGTRSSTVFKWDATIALNDWLRNWRDAQPNLPESQVVRHETVHGYGAGYFEVAWQLVEFSNQAVPLQSHHGVMVFGGNWVRPSGPHCVGSSSRPPWAEDHADELTSPRSPVSGGCARGVHHLCWRGVGRSSSYTGSGLQNLCLHAQTPHEYGVWQMLRSNRRRKATIWFRSLRGHSPLAMSLYLTSPTARSRRQRRAPDSSLSRDHPPRAAAFVRPVKPARAEAG